MKTIIKVEDFETMRERKLTRARKLDSHERIASQKQISFETPEAMLACITPQRLRLCEIAREQPRSITDLALALQRDRKAVYRDVKALHTVGILRLQKKTNPGHGQINLVEATASRFHLTAEM